MNSVIIRDLFDDLLENFLGLTDALIEGDPNPVTRFNTIDNWGPGLPTSIPEDLEDIASYGLPDGGNIPYAPDNSDIDGLLAFAPVALNPLDPTGSYPDFIPRSSKADLESHVLENFNPSEGSPFYEGSLLFNTVDVSGGVLDVSLGYNETGYGEFLVPGGARSNLASLVSTTYLRAVTMDATATITTGHKVFPTEDIVVELDLIALAQVEILGYILHFQLPMILGAIVYENEYKLLGMMKISGLRLGAYYAVLYTFAMLLYVVAMGGMWAIGAALGLNFFLRNSPGILIIWILSWSQSLIGLAVFLSVWFNKTRTAAIVGYVALFALVASAQIFEFTYRGDIPGFGGNTNYELYDAVAWIPSFALNRAMFILGDGAAGTSPGISWSQFGSSGVATLCAQMAGVGWGLMFLAGVAIAVNPSHGSLETHSGLASLFFKRVGALFSRRSGGSSSGSPEPPTSSPKPNTKSTDPSNVVRGRTGSDVDRENNQVSSTDPASVALLVRDLKKTYPAVGSRPPVQAVRGLSFSVRAGNCFGLLGPNGCGKSTTIHSLTGFLTPTSGNAWIGGHHTVNDPDGARAGLGLCPQHDILWGDLTPKEHMKFYAVLKGVDESSMAGAVRSGLEAVKLWGKRHALVKTLSGGMKRRLSVALSFLGNPTLIILDEPTTGLDPSMRSKVWELVHGVHSTSAVVLTTHSMEEAEALCDRLAILADGKMRTVGEAQELKARFGSGYTITLTTVNPSYQEPVIQWVKSELLPKATLTSNEFGVIKFHVSKSEFKLSETFARLESDRKTQGIADFGISQTTLEDVFLKISAGSQA